MLTLYNTLTRTKEPFTPLKDVVSLYTCGPTVYNYAHIGNLRTYIFEDILKRVLLYNKCKVNHVMNITDVGHLTSDADEGEDKMEKGAAREGKTVWEIAEYYTKAFQDDIHKLHILDPDTWCKATDHIQEQIEQIQTLEKNGFTYTTSDGVYFDTSKLDDYGEIALLDKENLKAGARVDMGEKKNPTDFALWKFSKEGENRAMEWESPWNKSGYPGWHIECSAMSMKYLGEQFDIHCGGIDHISVHHTNEIAQAEGATGKKPWVQFWLHGEFLVLDKAKMAKSGENFLTLQTLVDKEYDPLVYRYFCLTAHYKQQLQFSWEALETARNGFESIKTKLLDLKENSVEGSDDVTKHEAAFLEAVNDDLNMPQALAALWAVLRDDSLSSEARVATAEQFDAVFGLGIADFGSEEIPEEITKLAEERETARKEKDWAKSDELRDTIAEKGYSIEDKKEGYILRKK
ncbi:MAG: cysteine--tRNA ligase [Candidatus Woesearchaeota archaeon]|nr:cysteine--tRNA ligase [Candidatus Woesearchaeota archaeon]